jgi:hypothetical protein
MSLVGEIGVHAGLAQRVYWRRMTKFTLATLEQPVLIYAVLGTCYVWSSIVGCALAASQRPSAGQALISFRPPEPQPSLNLRTHAFVEQLQTRCQWPLAPVSPAAQRQQPAAGLSRGSPHAAPLAESAPDIAHWQLSVCCACSCVQCAPQRTGVLRLASSCSVGPKCLRRQRLRSRCGTPRTTHGMAMG